LISRYCRIMGVCSAMVYLSFRTLESVQPIGPRKE
jgi:hypothetical protein